MITKNDFKHGLYLINRRVRELNVVKSKLSDEDCLFVENIVYDVSEICRKLEGRK